MWHTKDDQKGKRNHQHDRTTEVPIGRVHLPTVVERGTYIYAIKTRGKLYGRERSVVVYTNRERGVKEADARNEALAGYHW